LTGNGYQLSETESEWWDQAIQDFRKRYVKTPREYIEESIGLKKYDVGTLKGNVESLLIDERESIYQLFLRDESRMNAKLVSHLMQNRDFAKSRYEKLLATSKIFEDKATLDIDVFRLRTTELYGEVTGEIFPYLYSLSLSSTNSRRARAGGTFEMLIEKCLEILDYTFQNQSSLGTDFYKSNRIGKKVDIIIPGRKAYEQRRTDCGIISAKTTLRERWQEVVEELNRSNVRHIYLATLDEGITSNQVDIMKEYNITLIVRKSEKIKKFSSAGNVESFDTFFNRTVPHLLAAWPEYTND